MCGIAGYWTTSGRPVDATAMADALRHRGPDDGGAWSDDEAGIALAHRRLAIVDLSPAGRQPMTSPCGRYVLLYNGEIYNHRALRAELDAACPIAWRGHSDTETLLLGIAHWGLDATLRRAVGMFAIALWDRQEQTLALARDRIGEKPLYYGWCAAGLVFGSELKALRCAPGFGNPVDPEVLSLYLRFNAVPAPWSILERIFKIEPGVIVTLDRTARFSPPSTAPGADRPPAGRGIACRRYWSLDAVVAAGADEAMDAADAVGALEARLTEAIRLQTVADVPVGAFLSGGIDSSAIVALMRNAAGATVRTFTIGFEEAGFDEAPHARAVARHLGTEHHEAYVTAAETLDTVADMARIYDEPFADSSQIPTVLLSRMTRRSVTVALSGDAGDELFGGYNRYLAARRYAGAAMLPAFVRRGVGRAVLAVPPAAWDRVGRLPLVPQMSMLGAKLHKAGRVLLTSPAGPDLYRAATEPWHDGLPLRAPARLAAIGDRAPRLRPSAEEQMMHWDMASYLPDDILTKVDRAAMASSLETRVPFLDHRVVEHAWRMPLRHKIRDGRGKWALRQILYRHVPRSLVERPKAGFAIPVGAWLRGPLRDWAEDLLSAERLADQPAFDPAAIRSCWSRHLAGRHDATEALWSVLMYQAWAAEWGGGTGPRMTGHG